MNKVTIFGQFLGTSGYSSHSRQLANALMDIGVDVKISMALFPGWEQQVSDRELLAIQKPDDKDRIAIVIMLSHHWQPIINKGYKKFFGFCVWEGDKVPKGFLPHLLNKKVDKILVPSSHTKKAILNRIYEFNDDNKYNPIETKIEIIPHGVDLSLFNPEYKKIDNKFTFICNSGWSQGMHDRKGVQHLLKAYLEEFKKEEPVRLILKVNPAYNNPQWNFDNECKKIGIEKNDKSPDLMVNFANIEYKIMRNVYNMGDIFISPTMADAFNMPCIEAMACEKPVITTDFGGQTDFVNDKNGWIIGDGNMIEVDWDLLYEGTKWKKPNIDAIKKVMRYVFEHQDEVKIKGKQALLDSKLHTWRNTAEKLKKILL